MNSLHGEIKRTLEWFKIKFCSLKPYTCDAEIKARAFLRARNDVKNIILHDKIGYMEKNFN